jgi:hypothetical protein
MLRRRRPLLAAAAVGGTAYAVGRNRARAQDAQYQRDTDQEAAIADLQQQQQQQQPGYAQPVAPPAAAPQPAGMDLTAELTRLSELHNSGVLTDAEFEAAKQKIISG